MSQVGIIGYHRMWRPGRAVVADLGVAGGVLDESGGPDGLAVGVLGAAVGARDLDAAAALLALENGDYKFVLPQSANYIHSSS